MSSTATFDPSDWPIAWMARAERLHARNATALLQPHGIHHREFRLLAFLASGGPCSVVELAEMAVLERPTVSKMLDRLEREGWVRRTDVADDARRWRLMLTPAGRAKFATTAPLVRSLFERYQKGVLLRDQRRFVREVRDFYRRVQLAGASADAVPGIRPSNKE